MKTKKVKAEIQGREVIEYYRTVILEVPEDMPDEEIGCVNADHFNQVAERTDWEPEDSTGIYAEGFPDDFGEAAEDAEPDVIVTRDENGEYRVCPNEKFVV